MVHTCLIRHQLRNRLYSLIELSPSHYSPSYLQIRQVVTIVRIVVIQYYIPYENQRKLSLEFTFIYFANVKSAKLYSRVVKQQVVFISNHILHIHCQSLVYMKIQPATLLKFLVICFKFWYIPLLEDFSVCGVGFWNNFYQNNFSNYHCFSYLIAC